MITSYTFAYINNPFYLATAYSHNMMILSVSIPHIVAMNAAATAAFIAAGNRNIDSRDTVFSGVLAANSMSMEKDLFPPIFGAIFISCFVFICVFMYIKQRNS